MNKIFTISIALLLSACSTNSTTLESGTENSHEVTYKSFCNDLVVHLNDNKFEFMLENFDVETLLRNTMVGMDLKPDMEKALYKQMGQLTPKKLFASTQASIKAREGWYKINTSNERRCVIHSELTEEGLAVLELLMSDTSGMIKLVDLHDYVFNLKFSGSLREVLRDLLITQKNVSYLARSKLSAFLTAIKSKNVEKALFAFKVLPREFIENPVYLQRLLMLVPASHHKHAEVMAQLELVVDDKNKGLIFYDYYVEQENLEGVLKTIVNVEKRTSNDAIFEILRAASYKHFEKKSQFLNSMYEAIRLGSQYETSYWILFDFFTEENLFSDAILTLTILEDTFGYAFERNVFEGQEKYSSFIASSEFEQWIRSD